MCTVPAVGSSIPAISRSRVDLPQPDGPDEDHELAVVDLERHVVDRPRAVAEGLGQLGQSDATHVASHLVSVILERPNGRVDVDARSDGEPDGEQLRGHDGDHWAEPLGDIDELQEGVAEGRVMADRGHPRAALARGGHELAHRALGGAGRHDREQRLAGAGGRDRAVEQVGRRVGLGHDAGQLAHLQGRLEGRA
jgi:hypothetical protein